MHMMNWLLVIRVNCEKAVILITIQKIFFLSIYKNIILIFFESEKLICQGIKIFLSFFFSQNSFFCQAVKNLFEFSLKYFLLCSFNLYKINDSEYSNNNYKFLKPSIGEIIKKTQKC